MNAERFSRAVTFLTFGNLLPKTGICLQISIQFLVVQAFFVAKKVT